MWNRFKQKYNQFLFRRYGFDTGMFFEKIPLRYRIIPLFSPSLYVRCEGSQIAEWFKQGIDEAMKAAEK